MFYDRTNGAFGLLGVFYVERPKSNAFVLSRNYTSFGIRIKGSSTIVSGQDAYFAGNGSISYIPAGCSFHRNTAEDERLIIIHLQPFGKVGERLEVKQNAGALEPLFAKCLQLWEEGGAASYHKCMELLHRIFASLQQMDAENGPLPSEIIMPGVKWLQREFKNPNLTAEVLAKHCGISESYFRRLYHACYGQSPWQMILTLRFRHACNLLESGYYSPKQVSELSGFSDVKYFRTAFRKRCGMTPTEYKKRYQRRVKSGTKPLPADENA